MSRNEKAAIWFIGAMTVSLVAQGIVKREAAVLGLSALELAVIGVAVPVVARRFS